MPKRKTLGNSIYIFCNNPWNFDMHFLQYMPLEIPCPRPLCLDFFWNIPIINKKGSAKVQIMPNFTVSYQKQTSSHKNCKKHKVFTFCSTYFIISQIQIIFPKPGQSLMSSILAFLRMPQYLSLFSHLSNFLF